MKELSEIDKIRRYNIRIHGMRRQAREGKYKITSDEVHHALRHTQKGLGLDDDTCKELIQDKLRK